MHGRVKIAQVIIVIFIKKDFQVVLERNFSITEFQSSISQIEKERSVIIEEKKTN